MEYLTAVTLFSGGGGVEVGMQLQDITPVAAVEMDPNDPELSGRIIAVHNHNFPDCQVIPQAIETIDFADFPIKSANYLHASPSCKNFSAAGKKKESEADIEAAKAVGDAIKHLKPDHFTLEQVKGYVDSESWKIITRALDQHGYHWRWDVVNFADYGLPQSRQRLILRAGEDGVLSLPPKQKKQGWYDAIAHLIPDLEDSELLTAQQKAVDQWRQKHPDKESNLLLYRVGNSANRVRSEEQPVLTITASMFVDGKGNNRSKFGDIVLKDGTVKALSIEAMKILQGFPGWYEFPEGTTTATAGIILGNSVPPLFMGLLFEQKPEPYQPVKVGAIYAVTKDSTIPFVVAEDNGDKIAALSFHRGTVLELERSKLTTLEEVDPLEATVNSRVLFYKGKYQGKIGTLNSDDLVQLDDDNSLVKATLGSLVVIGNPEPEEELTAKVIDGKTFVLIDKIILDDDIQSRVAIEEQTVREYAADRVKKVDFPPIVVFKDYENRYWLGDGWHRTIAEKGIGNEWIHAEVRIGGKRDAILHSVGANADHGLRRSNVDKRKAVLMLLYDEEWGQWSNRAIARQCGVDEKTVRNFRKEMPTTAEVPQSDERVMTRDGKTMTINTKNIGKGKKEKFPRQVIVSSDFHVDEIRGTKVEIVARHGDGTYLTKDFVTVEPECIAEIPVPEKPVTSVAQEEKAKAKELGLKTGEAAIPDKVTLPDAESAGIQKIAQNQSAINQIDKKYLTPTQQSQLLKLIDFRSLSAAELRSIEEKVKRMSAHAPSF